VVRSILSLSLVAGCSETWVYAPTAREVVAVDEGVTVVEGEARLGWASAGMPPDDEIVSNALRLEVHPSLGERPVLEFPEADPADLGAFAGEPNLLNLHGVYADCGAPRCEAVVPFRITRGETRATELVVSGDAILSVESAQHRTSSESDDATLEIVVR
jgi:hypothetical protein